MFVLFLRSLQVALGIRTAALWICYPFCFDLITGRIFFVEGTLFDLVERVGLQRHLKPAWRLGPNEVGRKVQGSCFNDTDSNSVLAPSSDARNP